MIWQCDSSMLAIKIHVDGVITAFMLVKSRKSRPQEDTPEATHNCREADTGTNKRLDVGRRSGSNILPASCRRASDCASHTLSFAVSTGEGIVYAKLKHFMRR
jgi:hypothetical protein